MKIDKSSYYPKSPLGDDDEEDYRIADERVVIEETVTETTKADDAERPSPRDRVMSLLQAPEDVDSFFEDADSKEPPSEAARGFTLFSRIVSWVLVPMLMPVYGIMLAFGLSILSFAPMQSRVVITLIIALLNLVVPALFVLLLKRMGLVNDLGLNGRKERFVPYLITIACMAGSGWLLSSKMAPEWLVMFFLGGAAAGVVELIVNFWWKISAHCAGIAGIVALLVHIAGESYHAPSLLFWTITWIILAGLLGTSRLWLNRHTVWQVAAGYAVGFCTVYLMMGIA